MADSYKIELTCSNCAGTGVLPSGGNGDIPCRNCGGDGKLGEGTIEGADEIVNLTDKVNDNSDKLDDILEKLNE